MQSRFMSLMEAVINVAIGFGVAVGVQMAIFPIFGLHAPMQDHLAIGGAFTLVSVARSYTLRRVFEAIRMRAATTETAALPGGGGASDHFVMR
jgi:hypothetical protein